MKSQIGFVLFFIAAGCALALQFPAAAAAQSKERVIHSFSGGTDGANPEAGLIDVNGTLYGTTYAGGGTGCSQNQGCGTVFALDPKTGVETVIYSFCRQPNCADGQYPFAGLISVKGTLYGTTDFGGAYGYGTVFALDPGTGAERVVHAFGSGTDGLTPFAGLIDVKGTLYGTTEGGGTNATGTVFAVDLKTGVETVPYSFCSQQSCADGGTPLAGLISVNRLLYGTTCCGGARWTPGGGTVFALDPGTGAEKVVYSFCARRPCRDGRYPYASLVDAGGTLYGTTFWGGTKMYCRHYHLGCGTVFALDPHSGAETTLYSFCSRQNCTDGSEPVTSVIAVKDTLYGTTLYGGRRGCSHKGCGTVFALDPDSGAETVLHSFCDHKNCVDGALPQAGLIDVKGTLYGTTVFGGAYGAGTVFAIRAP